MAEQQPKKPGEYWAAIPESDRYVAKALDRIRKYRRWMRETGRTDRIQRAFRTRYGWSPDGNGNTAEVTPGGVQGELVDVTTNDFAALMDQSQVLITSQKPVFKAVANTGDYKSLAQRALAEGIIEDYERREALSEMDVDTVRGALLCSEGWRIQGWDASRGRVIAEVEGSGITEGDIVEHVLSPLDVALDPDVRSIERLPWIAFRVPYPRHDLIALLPHLKDKLEALDTEASKSSGDWDQLLDIGTRTGWRQQVNEDQVWVWEVRHKKTPALPKGRLVRFIDTGCVLFDSMNVVPPPMQAAAGEPPAPMPSDGQTLNAGYPYGKELFADCMAPERVFGSTAGHTAHFDLLGLQQCMDTVVTMAASAANAGGVSNLWTPDGGDGGGANLSVDQIPGGFNLLTSAAKPEEIKGVSLDPQVTEFGNFVMQLMRRRIGMNDASLGEPTKGMPAQLAALLQAQAQQFHNGLERSYQRMLERTRTNRLALLRLFAKSQRVAEIAGANDSWTLKEWQAQDIETVTRVSVEAVNPAMRTMAGRMAMGQDLLEKDEIDGRQYLDLCITGSLKDVWEFEEKNKARIQAEKEMLQRGIGLPPVDPKQSEVAGHPVFVVPPPQPGRPQQEFIMPHLMQTHWLDIPEYLTVIATPEALAQPKIVKNVLDLVHYKLTLWRQMDPAVILLLKGQPAPPPMMPMGMPGEPPPPGAGAGGPPPPGPEMANVPGPGPKRPINQPKPPKNPITGEQSGPPMTTPP